MKTVVSASPLVIVLETVNLPAGPVQSGVQMAALPVGQVPILPGAPVLALDLLMLTDQALPFTAGQRTAVDSPADARFLPLQSFRHRFGRG